MVEISKDRRQYLIIMLIVYCLMFPLECSVIPHAMLTLHCLKLKQTVVNIEKDVSKNIYNCHSITWVYFKANRTSFEYIIGPL